MRLLFSMDLQDYDDCDHRFVRNSARSVILQGGKISMIHSLQYDYYKFPGGGIEDGEDPVEAMIRETREEAGLVVVPASVRPYGYVHRAQRSDREKKFSYRTTSIISATRKRTRLPRSWTAMRERSNTPSHGSTPCLRSKRTAASGKAPITA